MTKAWIERRVLPLVVTVLEQKRWGHCSFISQHTASCVFANKCKLKPAQYYVKRRALSELPRVLCTEPRRDGLLMLHQASVVCFDNADTTKRAAG